MKIRRRTSLIICLVTAAADGSTHAADHAAPPRVVALGDSITKGVRTGVAGDEIFAALVERRLREREPGLEVINEGIGGERTDQALARLDDLIAKHRPSTMLVMYGTNDAYVDPGRTGPRIPRDEFVANLEAIIHRLRAAGVTPILMTEPAWAQGAAPDGSGAHPDVRLAEYMAACRAVAMKHAVLLVDHHATWRAAAAKGQDLGAWTTDQCHPNARGHAVLADTILEALPDPGR